ncbi:putative non-specific lipid-transfer protein [Bienertia sinuspersici]
MQKVGTKSAPSAQCCGVARNANLGCLCKYVTNGVQKFVSIDKAVYIAQYCGLPFQHGAKCENKFLNLIFTLNQMFLPL